MENTSLANIHSDWQRRYKLNIDDPYHVHLVSRTMKNGILLNHRVPCYNPKECVLCMGQMYSIPILELYNIAFKTWQGLETELREEYIEKIIEYWEKGYDSEGQLRIYNFKSARQ